MVSLIMAAILLLTPDCASSNAVFGAPVPWLGYPRGWDLPADLEFDDRVDLASGGTLMFWWSESQQARYLVHMLDWSVNADANGDHFGAHNFCGPYRLED